MAGWKHLETMGTPLAGSGSLRAGLRVAFEDRSGSRWLHPFLRLFATAHRPLPRFYAMSYDISCSNGWGSEIRCWLPMFQYQARLPKVSQFWSIPMSSSMVPHVCKSPKINHAFWVLFKLLREKKKGWSSHILPFFHIFHVPQNGLSPFVGGNFQRSTCFWGQVWAQTSNSPGAWMGCAIHRLIALEVMVPWKSWNVASGYD